MANKLGSMAMLLKPFLPQVKAQAAPLLKTAISDVLNKYTEQLQAPQETEVGILIVHNRLKEPILTVVALNAQGTVTRVVYSAPINEFINKILDNL